MRECFDACVDIILSESCALYAEACRSKVRLSVLSLFTPVETYLLGETGHLILLHIMPILHSRPPYFFIKATLFN